MDKMEKCKSCINYDKNKSNKNWIVCSVIPLSVIKSNTSNNCENYKKEYGT